MIFHQIEFISSSIDHQFTKHYIQIEFQPEKVLSIGKKEHKLNIGGTLNSLQKTQIKQILSFTKYIINIYRLYFYEQTYTINDSPKFFFILNEEIIRRKKLKAPLYFFLPLSSCLL